MSQHQASVSVSPLRRRMLDDMAMRGLHEDTQRNYIMSVRNFAAFLGRSPETATPEDVRRFQVHQADSGVQPPTINNAVSGCASCSTSRWTVRTCRGASSWRATPRSCRPC